MIRLFRNIRHQLLSEDRYSIYLLYAAGEMVLVVTGILLALQIDNWKDKRQQQNQLLEYEQVLAADLVKDSRLINETLSDLQRDTAHCWDFIRRMSSDDVSLDTLVRIARYEYNPWMYADISFNRNTFVGLQSTAKLGMLEPWLQEHLLELNELQLDYDRSIGGDTRMYLDQTMFYNQSYPFNDKGHVESDSKLADAIWEGAQFKELGIALNSVVAFKLVVDQEAISLLEDLQTKTLYILKELQ